MKKLFSFLLLSTVLTVFSFAQDKIAKGTSVKILEVGKTDSYYDERADFVGKDATAMSVLSKNPSGYYSGTLETEGSRTCFFTNVKVAAVVMSGATTTTSTETPKFITGTIKAGTAVYVAEISPDDSYSSDAYNYVSKRGRPESDMTMKEDGYYSGSFKYDDSSSAYFYKAKFSKEPVDKLVKTGDDVKSGTSVSTTPTTKDYTDWDAAKNDDDIKDGDKVEVTAVSPDDSYYDNKEDYVGKQGIAGDDLNLDDDAGGYGGTVTLTDGSKPYFFLVKLKKISSGTSSVKSSSSASIKAGTRVIVTDLATDDSYYSNKGTYIRKKGKVVDGLNQQTGDYYSGKIVFDDGTDAYFFKVKVTVLN